MTGKVQLNAVNLIGNYDDTIPGVGEKLGNFLITNIIGEMNIQGNSISIKELRIESDLAQVKVTGSFSASIAGAGGNSRANLNFIIEPTGLIRKYAEFNIEPLLKSLNILHDDGRMIYECRGGFSNCEFKKAQKQ